MSSPEPSRQRPHLSVAFIAKDARDLIAQSLQSIRQIADEIVVADTGSCDGTQDAAAGLDAKVIEIEWRDDFSAARNACLAETTGDWVLWLDAGERMNEEDARSLRDFVDNRADAATAYMLLVMLPPEPGGASGEQVGRVRLVPRRKNLAFEGRVRETMHPACRAAGLTIDAVPWRIHRTAHDHQAEVKSQKAARNLRLAELEIADHGLRPSSLIAKGEALCDLGDPGAARTCFRQARAAAEPASTEMLEAYYGELTSYDGDQGRRDRQLELCIEAMEVYPLDAQLLCAMGNYLQAQGRLDLAARAFGTAVEYGQINPEIWHLGDIAEVAAICLSLTLQLQGQQDEAREALETAQKRHPTSQRVCRHLIDHHVKQQRRKEALETAEQIPGEVPNREALRSAIRGACLAAEKNWISAKAYLETAHGGGCREPICFRWLALTLWSLGQRDELAALVHEWQTVEPGTTEVNRYVDALAASDRPQDAPAIPQPPPVEAPVEQPPKHLRIDQPAGQDSAAPEPKSARPTRPTPTADSPATD